MKSVSREQVTTVIFEHVRDGILVLDRNFRILSANNAVEKWIDRPVADLIEKDSREVFHGVNWLCPHCAAADTFMRGEVNVVSQKGDRNGVVSYAELSVYPIRDESGEVFECIVFIQDITERMLCHDEVLRLYNEVTQTKEYLEGIIDNSIDAIITSDLEGIITSWNKGAERIYGFARDEAVGRFLPFISESLVDPECENNQRIRNGEVLTRIETLRKRKDGTEITVSLTLSPIKNTAGEVIGISGISRDISEKKNVEKELIRRNQELSRVFFISSAMRGTLELDKVLRMILTAVTMGDGLGFNRAILFLVDEEKEVLRGAMGVGPASYDEAFHIWNRISLEQKTLPDIMHDIEIGPSRKDSFFDRLSLSIEIPLHEETILTKAVREKTLLNIESVDSEPLSDKVLAQQLGTRAYAVVPLVSRDKALGVLWVDNFFNNRRITEEDMRFLTAFSNNVASAIENARLFERVKLTEQELENIFESISDMVYFIGEDYVLKNVNRAVCKRVGKSAEEIIGRKCYEVFHGTPEPWTECPHQKTVMRRTAFVEEVEDPYMGGTFIISSSPIFDMSGEFMGTVNVVSDITELKTLRERVIKTDRLAALGEVAARVAHEIRNPLVSLGGFAKRLEKKLDGNLKEYADIIGREVDRLEAILNDILSFVKETRIRKETVDSGRLMDEVIALMGSEIGDHDIVLHREFGDPIELYVDPHRIKDALVNILKNAVQAIGSNGTITIRITRRDEACLFEIVDTGPGIAEEALPFIFDPFFTTKKFGTGLGLTITHRIIEEHDGTITVKSRQGEGSTFRVFIPLKKEKEKGGGI